MLVPKLQIQPVSPLESLIRDNQDSSWLRWLCRLEWTVSPESCLEGSSLDSMRKVRRATIDDEVPLITHHNRPFLFRSHAQLIIKRRIGLDGIFIFALLELLSATLLNSAQDFGTRDYKA